MDILLTWIGARDPGWDNPRTGSFEPGPVISLLTSRRFDIVYLLFNLESRSDDFRQRANAVLRFCQQHFPETTVRHRPIDIVSVIDYREIYRAVNHTCQLILADDGTEDRHYFVYLSPGTPQMQAVWILLVQSGLLPARMLDATPRDLLAPDASPWREVDLSLPAFPQVISPGELDRVVGILEAQLDNLTAENQRLHAELALLKSTSNTDGALPESGFSLPDALKSQERAYFAYALERANGNAANAARLLGIEPAAFRARADTLKLRNRKKRLELNS